MNTSRVVLRWSSCAVLLLIGGERALAQTEGDIRTSLLAPTIASIREAKEKSDTDTLEAAVEQFVERLDLVAAVAAAPEQDLRFIAEANRLDKQVGSSNRAPGSTNLVSSGSVPRVLGFAVESGALTQTVSGTSVTFQTNPAGLVQALAQYGVPDEATRNTLSVLRRFNVAFTFDTSRDPAGQFTGDYQQLQQFATQVYLRNHRDPTDPRWARVWQAFRERAANLALPDAVRDLAVLLQDNQGFTQLRAETRARLLSPSTPPAEVENVVLAFIDRVRPFIAREQAARISSAWASYLQDQLEEYRQIARSLVVTAEYRLARPPIQDAGGIATPLTDVAELSDLSTLGIIVSRPFIGPSDMTVNATLSFFNQAPAGADSRVRDWQFGGKLDFPLNGIAGLTTSRLTLAALYMRLELPPLGFPVSVNGITVSDTGSLGFLQARLEIPVGDNGFSIPISLTYATRTELIDEQRIRGNVGMTIDLDKLATRRH